MTRSFQKRLFLLSLVWALVSIPLLTYHFHMTWQNSEQSARQFLHKDLARHMRDENPLMEGNDYSPKALKSIFHTLMMLGPDFEIYFLDKTGKITTTGLKEGVEFAPRVDIAPIKQFLKGGNLPILGDDPRDMSRQKVFSVSEIQGAEGVEGYLYVLIGRQSSAIARVNRYMIQYSPILVGGIALILLFTFLIYRLIKKDLLNPSQHLIRQIEHSAKENFRVEPNLKVPVSELMPLSKQFGYLLEHIQWQFLRLRQQEHSRREYLMRLSHDLKTPLANIQGYLETWLIDGKQNAELISTAHSNALKLHEQLKEQFEAAKKELVEPEVAPEAIDVSEFIKELKDRFEMGLEKKSLDIFTTISVNALVHADKKLLNRLMDNLMENAIRHSPEHATIQLFVKPHSGLSSQLHVRDISIVIINTVAPANSGGELGMGLKTVNAILALHQSKLEISEQPGLFIAKFRLQAEPISDGLAVNSAINHIC
ncbi:putative Signal transduction histidine kinase [Vibrio nigripulchritudo SOn1]|uniref:histidine kinase n=1 Tax=Vibrio nigripulchritudo SOn1 TaxID=1238450 RepID=A0AAV2VKN5_9VIBR|nr:HAMP domain-containing sensor histidine kinase [Vibrio nigripulchritudo]CCO45262.1 putative Signal transduction histidine kinase [Vibrio nigripulchritudo SOn1]